MMTATYSPDDNKLRLYSVTRLDPETYARVRAAGFIWAPKQDLFVAPMWTPDRADLLLELCGEIDDEDTSLADRADERADRFEDYSEKRAGDAKRTEAAVSRLADGIPLGQPILVGHHSERHARRDAERIDRGMRRTLQLWKTSAYWERRAAGALRHAKYKERADVRARRIKTIEADKRKRERERDEAAKWVRGWAKLNAPHRGEELHPGVYAMDGAPCDDALRMRRALALANYSRVSVSATAERPHGSSLWSELSDGRVTPRAAQLLALKAHARTIARSRRWIDHFDNRLTYERAMLGEQGRLDLLAPKPKSAKAQLPLCNYRAPGGLDIENIYDRGRMIHYPQVEMTAAEYTAINKDYKGTRVVDHSHRVRTCMQRLSLVCVFLTDSKVHDRPAAVTPVLPEPRAVRSYTPRTPSEAEQEIERLRAGVAAGVQVVSAPQLFPTPAALAERVIDLAEINEGDRVLEPSAGTGSLASAVVLKTRGSLLCIEINPRLVEGLQRAGYPTDCADFLRWNTDHRLRFDRIVMNPPFADGIDITHIEHARRMLSPGGRLVSICANGPRQRAALQDDAAEWIDLPAGTFAEAGTQVNTAIVVIDACDEHCTCSTCIEEHGRRLDAAEAVHQ